jgi:hypothetical protein
MEYLGIVARVCFCGVAMFALGLIVTNWIGTGHLRPEIASVVWFNPSLRAVGSVSLAFVFLDLVLSTGRT